MSNEYLRDLNLDNKQGTKGRLACCWANLMKAMYLGEDKVVSPKLLKKISGKINRQFSSFGQQDS